MDSLHVPLAAYQLGYLLWEDKMLKIEKSQQGDVQRDTIRMFCDECEVEILPGKVIYVDPCNRNPLEFCSWDCVVRYGEKKI